MGGVGLLILMLLVIMFFSLKVPGMATERELSYPEFMVYLENKTAEAHRSARTWRGADR